MAMLLAQLGDVLAVHRSACKKGIFFSLESLSKDELLAWWQDSQTEIRALKVGLRLAMRSIWIQIVLFLIERMNRFSLASNITRNLRNRDLLI